MPNWFFDSLPWIGRKDMANSSLIYSCKALKQLCLPKPHIVNYLDFHGEHNDETGIYEAKLEKWGYGYLPIAQVPSPSFIIGFNNIIIRSVMFQRPRFSASKRFSAIGIPLIF
jgi:hypothetical protein